MDATACRVLERLLPAAADHHPTLLAALTADADTLFDVATSPYGSHLLEALLTRDSGKTLAAVVALIAQHIGDLVDHKYGSFVARHVLRLLLEDDGSKPRHKQGLAALLAPPTPPPRVVEPVLLQSIIDAVVADPTLPDWPCHQFASPFLQALLHVAPQPDWCRLVCGALGGGEPDTSKKSRASWVKRITHETVRDRVGSHFVEAIFTSGSVSSNAVTRQLYQSMIASNLLELATHPHANFAVQAALQTLRGDATAAAIAQLTPHVGDLLTSQRGGVVVALVVAAAAEPEAHGAAACAMLAAPGKRTAGAHAPLLYILYNDAAPSDAAPLSTIGCALLHVVFTSFSQAQCQVFGNALATLPPTRLVAMATSPAGVRVLEAFIMGPASKKQRRGVLTALQHAWGAIASGTMAGCVFAEKCAAVADAVGREAIVKGLAGSLAALRRSSGGAALLSTLHVEAYVRDPEGWRRRQAQGDTTGAQFLSEVLRGGGVGEEQPKKKRRRQREELDGFVDMLSVGI